MTPEEKTAADQTRNLLSKLMCRMVEMPEFQAALEECGEARPDESARPAVEYILNWLKSTDGLRGLMEEGQQILRNGAVFGQNFDGFATEQKRLRSLHRIEKQTHSSLLTLASCYILIGSIVGIRYAEAMNKRPKGTIQ